MAVLLILAGITMTGMTGQPGWFVVGLLVGCLVGYDTYNRR